MGRELALAERTYDLDPGGVRVAAYEVRAARVAHGV
jgi:hypothetical protein